MLLKYIKMQYCRVACCLLDLNSRQIINFFHISFLYQFYKLDTNLKTAELYPTEITEIIPQKWKKKKKNQAKNILK